MKYLIFASMIFIFSYCNPASNINKLPCYFVITANDSLNSCNSPNHTIQLDWSFGTYQMNNISSYTTSVFQRETGYNITQTIAVRNLLNRCNNITVDLYINSVLSESQTVELGYQSDCQTYCLDGNSIGLTFQIP